MADFDRDSMSNVFINEMRQLIDQLEQDIKQSKSGYSIGQINEIFRIMHTIKGSAAMMMYDSISTTAHSIEDLFYYLREENPGNVDYQCLTELVLSGMDFIRKELDKVQNGYAVDGDGSLIIAPIKQFLEVLKGGNQNKGGAIGLPPSKPVKNNRGVMKNRKYKAAAFFAEDSEMVNIRAYNLLRHLQTIASGITHIPKDIIDEGSVIYIRKNGFILHFESSKPVAVIEDVFNHIVDLKYFTLDKADVFHVLKLKFGSLYKRTRRKKNANNPGKVTMPMRMAPLSDIFTEMQLKLIVSSIGMELGKDVQLDILGEDIEVDMNVIEHISDSLLHIILNCVDHGIEKPDVRHSLGKNGMGRITLEVKKTRDDLIIIIKDDGSGLEPGRILDVAQKKKMLEKPQSDYTEKEIIELIFKPGFTTISPDETTILSGRGVGLDVVAKNLRVIGGTVYADSVTGQGVTFTLKIPLSLSCDNVS